MDGSIIFASWRQYASCLIYASLGPLKSTSQTASPLFKPFLHSSWLKVRYCTLRLSPQNCPSTCGIWTPSNIWFPGQPSPHSEQHVDRFSCYCRAHDRDRQTDRPRYSVCSNRLHLHSTITWPNNKTSVWRLEGLQMHRGWRLYKKETRLNKSKHYLCCNHNNLFTAIVQIDLS